MNPLPGMVIYLFSLLNRAVPEVSSACFPGRPPLSASASVQNLKKRSVPALSSQSNSGKTNTRSSPGPCLHGSLRLWALQFSESKSAPVWWAAPCRTRHHVPSSTQENEPGGDVLRPVRCIVSDFKTTSCIFQRWASWSAQVTDCQNFNRNAASPTLISSPLRSTQAISRRLPFTKVPFWEPRSSR